MEPTNSSTNSLTDWRILATKYGEQAGKIFQWARLGAVEDMHAQWDEQQKNREAESAAVREKAWGAGSGETMASDDEMRQTILGDVTHPAPVVITPQQQSTTLQTAVLAAALTAAAGMGGYMLAGKDTTEPVTPSPDVSFDDSSVTIGLGKIEDYLDQEVKK
jgi:hypothetical protein